LCRKRRSRHSQCCKRGYDVNVSGANLTETTINASNLGSGAFGLQFKLPVDEKVYAQPLYVPNVAIPDQGTHNVLYVATMNDTLYAFDADVGGTPIWSVNLASLVNATAVPWVDVLIPPATLAGNLGILSTPVIDPSTHILYVVACTLENLTAVYRLHAIDITSGAEPYGPGVPITGSYGGATFGAPFQTQRISLALAGNQVVFGFASMAEEKFDTYEGWVMAYNKLTLQQSGVFATIVSGNGGGGVWQAGRPPAVDSGGYVYVFSGNAKAGGYGYNGVNDFSESALKLDPSNGLALVDWFTAGNWSYFDTNDLHLSSSGPLLVPGTSLLAGGGKTGVLYALDTGNIGHWTANDSQVVQSLSITAGNEILGGPVYWEGSAATAGPLLYNWGANDVLRGYGINGSTFESPPSAQGTNTASYPGGIFAVSANGNVQGSGVLWATTAAIPAARGNPAVPSALHAFNAENIASELWNFTMNAVRDGYGTLARFMPPMIANGKVYVATWSNQVAVYGLLPYTVSPTSLAFGSNTTGFASAAQSVTVTNRKRHNITRRECHDRGNESRAVLADQ